MSDWLAAMGGRAAVKAAAAGDTNPMSSAWEHAIEDFQRDPADASFPQWALQFHPSKEARGLVIGPDSDVDQVWVRAQNGARYRLGVGHPLPVGRWRPPFALEHVYAGPTTTTRPGAAGIDITPKLELVATADAPLEVGKRPPKVWRKAGIVPATSAAIVAQVPFWGRQRMSFIVAATAQILTWRVYGRRYASFGTASDWGLYPTVGSSATTTTAAGATGTAVIERDHFDFLVFEASQPAGGTIALVIEARD